MNDIATNSSFIKSLEDSLNRLYEIYPDQVSFLDLEELKNLINRIAPNKNCVKVYFDRNYKDTIRIVPTYESVNYICKSLFDFDSKNTVYLPDEYVILLPSKKIFSSVKSLVALILLGIDNLSCPMKLYELKTQILNYLMTNDKIAGSKALIFNKDADFNINITNLLLPSILEYYEYFEMYTTKSSLIEYITDKNMSDPEKQSLVINHGYLEELPNPYDLDEDQLKKNNLMYKSLINNILDIINKYPLNKGEITNQYKTILSNPTAGQFEKELADKILNSLKTNNNSIFDDKLREIDLNESMKSFIEMKKKGSSELEISELMLELETLEYQDDKLYLITRIHRDIQTAIRYKKKHPNDSTTIDEYIAKLKEILEAVRNKKIKKDELTDFYIDTKSLYSKVENDFEYGNGR